MHRNKNSATVARATVDVFGAVSYVGDEAERMVSNLPPLAGCEQDGRHGLLRQCICPSDDFLSEDLMSTGRKEL